MPWPVRRNRAGSNLRTSAHAHAGRGIVVQGLLRFRQRGILRTDRCAIGPIRRTDGDIARVTAKAAAELRIADDHERSGLRYLVEIGDAFGLRVAVMHQPHSRLGVESVSRGS